MDPDEQEAAAVARIHDLHAEGMSYREIASVSPHWLRHAHASHALDRGTPIHLVPQDLEHASVATTSRYLHARPDDGSANYLPA